MSNIKKENQKQVQELPEEEKPFVMVHYAKVSSNGEPLEEYEYQYIKGQGVKCVKVDKSTKEKDEG